MVSNKKLNSEAIILRKRGDSYLNISKKLGIAKSTLSGWFANEPWSKEISLKNTQNSLSDSKNSLVRANAARLKKQIARHEAFRNQAKIEFMDYYHDPLFTTGVSLYWGEGEKTQSGRVSLVNTDPSMVVVILRFYKKFLKIRNSELRVGLFIYEDHSEYQIKTYWSRLLNLPKTQFIKTQYLKSRSNLTKRKSKYGICSLYFSSTEQSVKIREWIRLLFETTTHKNKRD